MRKDFSPLINCPARNNRHRNLPDPGFFTLVTGIGLNFFRFLISLGITHEQNLVVLSSKDNYSCSENELKNARVIVNLKRLNLIKHLDLFLNSLVRILPPNTSFIGCFSDVDAHHGSGFRSIQLCGFVKRIFKVFGYGTSQIMNKNDVTEILEKNGFKTLNMKKMSGLTYFVSQNIGIPQ